MDTKFIYQIGDVRRLSIPYGREGEFIQVLGIHDRVFYTHMGKIPFEFVEDVRLDGKKL